MDKTAAKEYLVIFTALLAVGFICYSAPGVFKENSAAALAPALEDTKEVEPPKTVPWREEAAADPALTAESVIVVESNLVGENTVLFSRNGNAQVPIASITKIMTAMVAIDSFGLDEPVVFGAGNVLPTEQALRVMLIESNNTIAEALAQKMGKELFVLGMNKKAAALGLHDTVFTEPTGIADSNRSTANDLAGLAIHVAKNYPAIVLASEVEQAVIPGYGTVVNTNQLLGQIPEIIVGKTGFTTSAKECLLLVLQNPRSGGYLVNVILGSDHRFAEMQELINWVNGAYHWE